MLVEDLKNTIVVILSGGLGTRLRWATHETPKPALSFGGKFRIIDFGICNAINSGVQHIEILAQFASSRLQEHVKNLGFYSTLFVPFQIEVRTPQHRSKDEITYTNTANAVYQDIDELRKAKDKDSVLVIPGDAICKMDYRVMVAHHRQAKSDFTIAGMWVPRKEAHHFGIIEFDDEGDAIGFYEKPGPKKKIRTNAEGKVFASIGVYYADKEFMIKTLEEDHERVNSGHDFGNDVIPWLIKHTSARVVSYDIESHTIKGENGPYWRDVGRLNQLLEAELDLVRINPGLNIYNDREWPLKSTAPSTAASAKLVEFEGEHYADTWKHMIAAEVESYVVERAGEEASKDLIPLFTDMIEHLKYVRIPGLTLAGNCILDFPCNFDIVSLAYGVRVGRYSYLSETVVHPNVVIGEHVKTKRVIILDKAVIPSGWEIGFDPKLDEERGFYVEVDDDGQVVVLVPRGYRAPEHLL